jgi:hypothetical protein
MECYWGKIYQFLKANPQFVTVVPGFLVCPQELVFYFGRTHLGVEYVGPEAITKLPESPISLQMRWFDFTLEEDNFLGKIIGFNYGQDKKTMALPPFALDLILPTNAGFDELQRLKWNWAAEDMIVGLNTGGVFAPAGQFTRIVNGRFFDCDNSGLRTRHIKWLDLIPLVFDDTSKIYDSLEVDFSPFFKLAEVDARTPYPMPPEFKQERLARMNRFVEIVGDQTKKEPEITAFLSAPAHRFILTMRFGAREIHPHLLCRWQSADKKAIQPDFFVVGTDGYGDIVEFKLPEIAGGVVVGVGNRETFSSEINSYISQTRVYREYFDDSKNRKWFEKKYGFRVYKPKRYLVLGRRWHFDAEEWKAIEADHQDLKILTYDDLIDGVVVQFYQ